MFTPQQRSISGYQGGYREKAQQLVLLRNAMTDDFSTALNVLRSDRHLTIEALAEKAMLSGRTIQRMCNRSVRREKVENILRLCFAMNLEPELSEKLLNIAGTPLMNTPEDMVYRMLLRDHYECSLDDINEILVHEGLRPLSQSA